MKITLWILSLIYTIASAQEDFSLYEKKEFKISETKALPYRILFPENYDRTKTYPLVLFLHGAGERGNDNEKQLTHGAKLFLSTKARKDFPCIVIFPQCSSESAWSNVKIDRTKNPLTFDFDYTTQPSTDQLEMAIQLIRKVIKEEGVDRKRVYITGLSMGGMGTFEAVFRFPKLFAAAMPICGGGDALHYNKLLKRIPFWVFHGAEDAVVSVNYSRQMVDKLKSMGAWVKYSEYQGVNHNSWDNAFAEPEFLVWMFSNKRK